MTDQLKENPSMLLFKTFDKEIKAMENAAKELNCTEINYLPCGLSFRHPSGYLCTIEFKAKK